MTASTVRVVVRVPLAPERAFELFTAGIRRWWRGYWNDNRATGIAFDPLGSGGRLLELWGDGGAFEIGRVTEWRPGEEVAFGWRQADWPAGESNQVGVSFRPAEGGTEVTLEHSGWEKLSDPAAVEGYDSGWEELLGWYVETASEAATGEPGTA